MYDQSKARSVSMSVSKMALGCRSGALANSIMNGILSAYLTADGVASEELNQEASAFIALLETRIFLQPFQ
jgi:hypothetical protein